MLRLTGYGVKNLRSLKDTGLIEIKPLTILVGKNSAGKSSFARILPLLKQSAERRKQAPLLWYGRLVDFGSFNEVLSSFAKESEIEISFRFSSPDALSYGRRIFHLEPSEGESTSHIDVRLKLGCEGDEARTVLKELILDVFGLEVAISVKSPRDIQITIQGVPATIPSNARLISLQGSILPLIRLFTLEQSVSSVSDAALFQPQRKERIGTHEARRAISAFVHGNTLDERKDEIASRLPVTSIGNLLKFCRELSSAPDTWRNSMLSLSPNNAAKTLAPLQSALVLYRLDSILIELDDAMQSFCNGVSYLEPLRATAQRYYRREEVSIDELDPKGLNTTFFIQGLSSRERESMNSWLESTFGFTLNVKTAGGHSSLNIDVGTNGQSRNMADVGLGYSQIVPVAIQLWAATSRRPNRNQQPRNRPATSSPGSGTYSVVIEQPELHLHPAYQAKLADVFVSCISPPQDDNREPSTERINLIAETHSPNLINKLGELVSAGKLKSRDVQVLVFEQDESEKAATYIRTANFDEKGVLRNWPIGFFDY